MEYMYAAMLLHSAGKEISEDTVSNVLNAAGINYTSLKAMKAMKMLEELEQQFPVGR